MIDPGVPVRAPIEVLSFGSVMLVIVVLIHGAGLDRIIGRYKRKSEILRRRSWHPHLATLIFAGSILLMLFLHVFEFCVWGLVLRVTGLIGNTRDSMYFSANTYTTIGYGQMVLPYNWRELSPLMAISGLFTFAWTTGEMFNIVENHHQLVEELTVLRNKKRAEMKWTPPADVRAVARTRSAGEAGGSRPDSGAAAGAAGRDRNQASATSRRRAGRDRDATPSRELTAIPAQFVEFHRE